MPESFLKKEIFGRQNHLGKEEWQNHFMAESFFKKELFMF